MSTLNQQETVVGSAQITDGSIVNADVNTNAAIAFSKLATLSRGNVLIGNSSNVAAAVDVNDSGKILVGDGTDLNSVSVSGDATLSSAGVVTLSSSFEKLLYKSTTAITINNDASETTIVSYSVPGGTLSTGNYLMVTVEGSWLNNTGSNATITMSLKFGATTVASAGTGNVATNANTKHYRAVATLVAQGATNSQWGGIYQSPNATASASDDGTAAEDSTGAKTLVITAQLSTNSTNLTYIMKAVKIALITP